MCMDVANIIVVWDSISNWTIQEMQTLIVLAAYVLTMFERAIHVLQCYCITQMTSQHYQITTSKVERKTKQNKIKQKLEGK